MSQCEEPLELMLPRGTPTSRPSYRATTIINAMTPVTEVRYGQPTNRKHPRALRQTREYLIRSATKRSVDKTWNLVSIVIPHATPTLLRMKPASDPPPSKRRQ